MNPDEESGPGPDDNTPEQQPDAEPPQAAAPEQPAPPEPAFEPEPPPRAPEPEPPPQIYTEPPQHRAPVPDHPVRAYEPAPEPETHAAMDDPYAHDEYAHDDPPPEDDFRTFGDSEIPMPQTRRPGDKKRARDARRNLDLDLGRIKRRKRYGLVLTTISVLFVAFVLAPVTWSLAYLFFDPPSNILMMQRAASGETIRHYPVPLNRMSPHVVRAVIAAEDANFCTHDGFDVEAIQDAVQANRRGGRTRGASTISQQTAKNLFLWPERSWVRKGFETYFTALIEFMWPKRRIMEAYLNTAEWGDGNFGIEAAARARFGVSAADLTPLQAARLAAVLPSPNRWRADSPGPYVRRRAASIVERARVVRNERMASCVLALDRPSTP